MIVRGRIAWRRIDGEGMQRWLACALWSQISKLVWSTILIYLLSLWDIFGGLVEVWRLRICFRAQSNWVQRLLVHCIKTGCSGMRRWQFWAVMWILNSVQFLQCLGGRFWHSHLATPKSFSVFWFDKYCNCCLCYDWQSPWLFPLSSEKTVLWERVLLRRSESSSRRFESFSMSVTQLQMKTTTRNWEG